MTRSRLDRIQISIRFVWPFARLIDRHPHGLASLATIGIGLAEYANPDTRLSLGAAAHLIEKSIEMTGDPAVGLRAGELQESGDFDALEYAARSCSDLREAIGCIARHTRLISDTGDVELVEQGDRAILAVHLSEAELLPPAINDYLISSSLNQVKRHTGGTDIATEIQLVHGPTAYIDEYRRVFGVPIAFNAPYNAIVFHRKWLDAPMVRANPRLSAAFQLHVRQLLDRLQKEDSVADRTRAAVATRLAHGDIGMGSVSRALGMSVATLRRRLKQENVRYTDIVEQLREQLAQRYLRDPARSLRDVAFLLGFSDIASFHKAFKRWTGMTPAEYRLNASDGVHGQGSGV